MTVAKDWARAMTEPLPHEWADEAARLAHEPATAARFTLPLSPGINGWWEPLTVYRDGHRVASLHLTKEAEAYTQMVWIAMRRQAYTPQRMAREFADMWLLLRLDVYAISPLAFDADAHTKPCQRDKQKALAIL